ncbi:MAG: ABC transporter ATP-binding protein [Paramuribaculum sp.]|nr:ABC transporter ATP-binding protein [Paramuribaculum sp.]
MKIEVKNISKEFQTDTVSTMALNNVSLTVDDGEFVAIMGPSGCGKSTLLNILGLLDNPTAGEYMIDGTEVGKLRENGRTRFRKGRLGFIFQSFNLIDEMNVRDNIMLPLHNLPLSRAEKNRRVDEAMHRMGIAHRSNHYPSQLSGGQQQRAAIARAVVAQPGLILADEPTGNLDSKNGAEVMELLDELHREGATIVMVTHSQKDAAHADRIINLFDGQIVENLNNLM